ncbi:MAG TPA: RNA polymerase sigma factor [Steroidobacteraceae bacterium]|nr:RNA polymerase sigma factor [Steroidobacteraceae bacterium]
MLPKTQKNFVADVAAKHGQRLRRFLAARLRNTADTADLAQEVFLRLLRVKRFEQIRSPEAYLLTVASHVIHQHSLSSLSTPATLDGFDELLDEHLVTDSDPVAQVHLERRLEALDHALARLPVRTRAVFVLQRRDGYTLDEISAQLGISRSAVRKHLAKALAQCSRQILEPRQERE